MKYDYRKTISLSDFRNQFKKSDEITYLKKIEKNTFDYIINGKRKIRLYETDIIKFKADTIVLNTSGFYTALTMNRLNTFLIDNFKLYYSTYRPYIYQNKSIWYYEDTLNRITRFFNGIEIDKETGKVINEDESPNYEEIDKKNERILKLIKIYCNEINDLKILPDDSSGDCLYCQLETTDNKSISNNDHLITHLREEYIMRSLIINALFKTGYTYPLYIYNLAKNNKNDRKQIIRAVKEYFKNRLIE